MTCARRLGVAAAGGLVLIGSRRVLLNWGATKHECNASLPGDDLVPEPAATTTRALMIDAPAEQVWRWLVQIGQDRGGMYSYDRLENLIGLRIHSTEWIHPEWQQLAVGDHVQLVRRGWFGMTEGYALTVRCVEPGRALVLHDPAWPAVWSFHLRPVTGHSCRLVTRGRAPRPRGARAVIEYLLAPVQFVMTRRMLLEIRRRAESTLGTSVPPVPGRADVSAGGRARQRLN
jgi:hypothetical protein